MKAADFIAALARLPHFDVTEGLKKELATSHIGQKAVCVMTSNLDLDTDGGNDPSIAWDKTHQSDTSLHWPKGAPVDANATPFVVIPGGNWGKRHNLKVGDVGLAQIDSFPDVVPVIIADIGPKDRVGEGSIALHRAFGHETVAGGKIRDVGMAGPFRMALFPNSGTGVCRNHTYVAEQALKLWVELGA